jgi:hypothetical protein
MLRIRSGNGTIPSWFPFSLLYTCNTALSAWAVKICEGLTAKQLVVVELFLKVDRSIEEGSNS